MTRQVMKYYAMVIDGGVEIYLHGPFATFEERDKEAKRLWQEELDSLSDNVFFLDCEEGEDPVVGSYPSGDLDEGGQTKRLFISLEDYLRIARSEG